MGNHRKIITLEANRDSPKKQLKELWERKDLLYFFVMKEIKILYSQTFLGIGWVVINPLLNALILTVVFNKLGHMESDNIPYALFCLSGLLPWIYFSSTITKAANGLVLNRKVITKVYFPKVFIPFTPLFAKLLDLFIGMICLLCFMPLYGLSITFQCIFMFIPLLILLFTTAGFSLWISGLCILFRDVKHAMPFAVHLLLFVSPVIFPASLVKAKFGYGAYLTYGLYPLVGSIEGLRASLLGVQEMPWDLMGASALGAILCFGTGLNYFQKKEKTFADL